MRGVAARISHWPRRDWYENQQTFRAKGLVAFAPRIGKTRTSHLG